MVTAADPRTLRSVRWPRQVPILDQGDLGACVGFALTGALGTAPLTAFPDVVAHVPDGDDAAGFARDLYSASSAVDPFDGSWPPDDTGTDGLSAAKVLKRSGVISAYRWASSLSGLLTLLQDGPVCMGMPWHEAFFSPDRNGHIDPPGWADTDLAGGHEVEIVGADIRADDLARSVLLVANSWGPGWGMQGFFRMNAQTYVELRSNVDLVQLRS
jgi:hypothetical protein